MEVVEGMDKYTEVTESTIYCYSSNFTKVKTKIKNVENQNHPAI